VLEWTQVLRSSDKLPEAMTSIDSQAYDYFINYPSDCLFVKITVIAVLFSNTVTTLAACALCYIVSPYARFSLLLLTSGLQYSVIHFGAKFLYQLVRILTQIITHRRYSFSASAFLVRQHEVLIQVLLQHKIYRPSPIYLFSSGIAIGGVQIFLLNRYWSLYVSNLALNQGIFRSIWSLFQN